MSYGRAPLKQLIPERLDARPVLLARRFQLSMQRSGKGICAIRRETGTNDKALYRILRGKSCDPSVWTMARLAVCLDVSLDYLTGLVDYNGQATPSGGQGHRPGYILIYE